MSCGLPINVPAAPMLLAMASAIRNGTGLSFLANQRRADDGREKQNKQCRDSGNADRPARHRHQYHQESRGDDRALRENAVRKRGRKKPDKRSWRGDDEETRTTKEPSAS